VSDRLTKMLAGLATMPLWAAGHAADLMWLHFGRKIMRPNRALLAKHPDLDDAALWATR